MHDDAQGRGGLYVETEVHDIADLDKVLLAFDARLAS